MPNSPKWICSLCTAYFYEVAWINNRAYCRDCEAALKKCPSSEIENYEESEAVTQGVFV